MFETIPEMREFIDGLSKKSRNIVVGTKIQFNNRFSARLADASYWKNEIRISVKLWFHKDCNNKTREETLVHEFCHLLVGAINKKTGKKNTAHGKLWKDLMRGFGYEPNIYHNIGGETRRPYRAICSCRTYNLSAIKYRRMRQGNNYVCKKCKGRLVLDSAHNEKLLSKKRGEIEQKKIRRAKREEKRLERILKICEVKIPAANETLLPIIASEFKKGNIVGCVELLRKWDWERNRKKGEVKGIWRFLPGPPLTDKEVKKIGDYLNRKYYYWKKIGVKNLPNLNPFAVNQHIENVVFETCKIKSVKFRMLRKHFEGQGWVLQEENNGEVTLERVAK